MKYKVELTTRQRNVIEIEADNKDDALVKFIDIITEDPEGYLKGVYDCFVLAPTHIVTEIK